MDFAIWWKLRILSCSPAKIVKLIVSLRCKFNNLVWYRVAWLGLWHTVVSLFSFVLFRTITMLLTNALWKSFKKLGFRDRWQVFLPYVFWKWSTSSSFQKWSKMLQFFFIFEKTKALGSSIHCDLPMSNTVTPPMSHLICRIASLVRLCFWKRMNNWISPHTNGPRAFMNRAGCKSI